MNINTQISFPHNIHFFVGPQAHSHCNYDGSLGSYHTDKSALLGGALILHRIFSLFFEQLIFFELPSMVSVFSGHYNPFWRVAMVPEIVSKTAAMGPAQWGCVLFKGGARASLPNFM